MSGSPPNLFEALFDFHPRESHTPKENFLTEAFAYLLRTDEAVRNRWLSRLLDQEVTEARCEVATRKAERDPQGDRWVFPDLVLDGRLPTGERFAVYCEHKWDSPCEPDQLEAYKRVVRHHGDHARLAFVGATRRQVAEARRCLAEPSCRCLSWQDVYAALDGVSVKSVTLAEFLAFMRSHALRPAPPLTDEGLRALSLAADCKRTLIGLAHRLNDQYEWDTIPARFHRVQYVEDAWGRACIRYETPGWRPGLAVGFLYDVTDHKVRLVSPNNGVDLILRIEADPKHTGNVQSVLTVLDGKREALCSTAASVLLKGESGNGNRYTVLIVQACLSDVIKGRSSLDEQAEVIHARLTGWLNILFGDGALEPAFKKDGLDSGM